MTLSHRMTINKIKLYLLKKMQLEKGYIYHIYNQGNNQQKIFYSKENYFYFLKKIKTHISPYAEVIAWCLMPNHFHIMLFVKEIEIPITNLSHRMTPSHPMTNKTRTLNNSIAIMLRSYTRAINKQQNTSGSLFRQKTKAECVNCQNGVTPSFFINNGTTKINITDAKKQYPQICFNYIHQNPVKANLVKTAIDWEFSSAIDYANLRNGKLVNKLLASEYVDF